MQNPQLLNLENPGSFESLDAEHLAELYKLASDNDIRIYVGAGSISQKSSSFSDRFGDDNLTF